MGISWKDIGEVVGKAAPIVGGLFGGPAGAVVGGLVSAALGVDNTPEAVDAALKADPEAMAKVIEIQTNAKVQLQQLAVQAEQNRLSAENAQYTAEANDRDSARKMAMARPDDWWIRPVIALSLLAGAMVIITFIFVPGTRDVIKDPIATGMLGTLFGFWFKELSQVMGFYFGATKEASDSTRKITEFAVAPGTVTADGPKTASK